MCGKAQAKRARDAARADDAELMGREDSHCGVCSLDAAVWAIVLLSASDQP